MFPSFSSGKPSFMIALLLRVLVIPITLVLVLHLQNSFVYAAAFQTKPPRVDPVCISSHIDYQTDYDKQTTLMQQAGMNWVRFDMNWWTIEQTKGVYDFSHYDTIINNVASKGMHVLASLDQWGLPVWERQDPSNWSSPPKNAADYGNFAKQLAAHYKGKISLYEVGNEPNISGFWPPAPDVAAYTAILKAADTGIKNSDRNAKVISAGLANESADTYAKGMYAKGARGYFDYFGFHPYSQPNSPDYTGAGATFSELAVIKQIMANNGDRGKNIMATEIGWPSSTTSSGGVDEATQALYIDRIYQKIEFENYQYVPIACIYDFMNDGTGLTYDQDNFGIVHSDYSQKPSYATMQQVRSNYNANFTPMNP